VDDARVGAAFRAVRLRRGLRQIDVATQAVVSRGLVSLIERGHVDAATLRALRRVAAVLDIRVDIVARWRAGELDRLLNARHAALADAVADYLRALGWEVAPEVSFAIGAERGWIDLLAWHAPTRTLLVIELKTEIVDLHDLIGTLDRKHRLAPAIARPRGWQPLTVARLVIVGDSATNRRRVHQHSGLLGAAFLVGTRECRAWLAAPSGGFSGLMFFADANGGSPIGKFAGRKRVRRRSAAAGRAAAGG
jgi:transcriptional regulator with XRE-family HTH domain